MALHTFSSATIPPHLRKPAGLTIKECSDLLLLSVMGEITLEEARKRLANDHLAFVAYIHEQPAAFGWMARGKATIGELNHELILPQKHRYLWNFRTLAKYRGLGIYSALLQYIIYYERLKADRFWIIHAPENKASLNGIVKAGFTYVGELFIGDSMKPEVSIAETFDDIAALEHMGFYLSEDIAASCWNCSSPFLKKRKPHCCCIETEQECTHNRLLAVA